MIDINLLKNIIIESKTYWEVARKLNKKGSGNIKRLCIKHSIDTGHFTQKLPLLKKVCPICQKEFEIHPHLERQVTCSYACSNKHFRTGPGNGNWKERAYRTTCFHFHEKKCVVCGEQNIVAVHHFDHNHENNSPKNLIPLCPTHHQYMHSNFRSLIEGTVNDYVNNFNRSLA